MQDLNSTLLKKPIGPIGLNIYKPIGYSPIGRNKEIDLLLDDCKDLIDSRYKKWFAKRFYKLTPKIIKQVASEARVDGKNPQALFCHKIKYLT